MNRFVWALVGGAMVLSVGCGSSSSDATNDAHAGSANGMAGDRGVAGSSAGGAHLASGGAAGSSHSMAGSAGTSVTVGDSKTEACIAYAVATCERHAECRNEPTAGCISVSSTCPDLVFSDGSTRTVAGVKACAEELKSFPCERLLNGESPDCITPGTRAIGQACAFASQCQSLECKGSGGCGVCASPGGEDDSCAGASSGCSETLYCNDQKQKCQLLPDSTLPSKFDGKTCISNNDCGSAGYCPIATHTCARLPSAGMSCAESLDCDANAYCGSGTRTCRAFQAEGDACGSEAAASANPYCQVGVGIVCNYTTQTAGTCVKLPAIGERCTLDEHGAPASECADGAHCDKSLSPPKCVAPNPLGATCKERGDCAPDQDCACPGGGQTCTSKICVEWRMAGQSCNDGPSSICHPGFNCVNMLCVPVDTRNLFALSCSAGSP